MTCPPDWPENFPPWQECGQYTVVPISGLMIIVKTRPTLLAIREAIGCRAGIDCVRFGKLHWGQAMAVDDEGMLDSLPINPIATGWAVASYGPEYPYCIHGIAVLFNDNDFES